MLKEWQFNVLFFVGVGGAVLLLIGPELGLNISQNPTAVTGVGAILTYVLTQKKHLTKNEHEDRGRDRSRELDRINELDELKDGHEYSQEEEER